MSSTGLKVPEPPFSQSGTVAVMEFIVESESFRKTR